MYRGSYSLLQVARENSINLTAESSEGSFNLLMQFEFPSFKKVGLNGQNISIDRQTERWRQTKRDMYTGRQTRDSQKERDI